MISMQREAPDMAYVHKWCEQFKVTDRVARALISADTWE
jgi:hypothetical protein